MSYDVQNYFQTTDVYMRRIVISPPVTEFEVYCHSELAIAQSYNDPCCITSILIDGVHSPIMKTKRIYRLPELGPTSTVRVSSTQECVSYVRVHIPHGQPFEDANYHYSSTVNHLQLYRSPSEITDYVRKLTHVRIDDAYWLNQIKDTLMSCRKLTSIHVGFSYLHTVSWPEVQDVILNMPDLDSLRVSYHLLRPFVFELFTNMPRKLQLDGAMELVGLERLVNVTDLTIGSDRCATVVLPPEIIRFLPNLQRLSLSFMRLTFPLLALKMTELVLYNMDLTFTDCVTIGRLLRRNQLQKLSVSRCPQLRKHNWRPVLMPLIDGSNTSLTELELTENDMSTHVYYMLEDIISFCPTLTRLLVPSCPDFQRRTIEMRQSYFNALGNVQIARRSVKNGSSLERAFTITMSQFAVFQKLYRRKNRVWKAVGVKEMVCSPLECPS
jgi:hypothetical protein